MLADSIEKFCTLSTVEQVDLHEGGNDSVDCYNNLIDHLGAKWRIPLIGDHLCDSNGLETNTVVTQEFFAELGGDAQIKKDLISFRIARDFF